MELAKTNRNISIDVLRILACALVVIYDYQMCRALVFHDLRLSAYFSVWGCYVIFKETF